MGVPIGIDEAVVEEVAVGGQVRVVVVAVGPITPSLIIDEGQTLVNLIPDESTL